MNQKNPNLPVIQRTKPPSNYIEPHDSEISAVAIMLGLNLYSIDMIRDLANIAAGGIILPPSARDEAIEEFAKLTLPPKGEDGEYYTGQKNANGFWEGVWTKNKDVALQGRIDMLTHFHNNVCDFLNKIDFSKIPGRSPIEKAMLLLKMLYHRSAENHYCQGGWCEEDCDDLPLFTTKGQAEATDLNDILDHVNDMDAIEEMFFEHHGQSNEGHNPLKKSNIAEDMVKGAHLWLKVSRKLDYLTLMRVSRSQTFIPDVSGKEVRSRPIKDFDELDKLRPIEYTYPKIERKVRLATRSAMMRERGTYEEKQQLLYIIIDCSASMQGERIHKAGGVLMNRLRSVVKEDAQLYCRFFDTALHAEHKATTPQEALTLMDQFRNENFSGGGTRIARCALAANDRIQELLDSNELLERPELVIVTDGDDKVHELTKEGFDPTRVHAFVVGNTNEQLLQFARDTGGVATGNL